MPYSDALLMAANGTDLEAGDIRGRIAKIDGKWLIEFDDMPHPSLLEQAVHVVDRDGGGMLRWWQQGATPDDDAVATVAGMSPERDLRKLVVALPHPELPPATPPTRGFRRGQDEAAWLEVNNRAFAGHPEQGGWDLTTLVAREDQPWFDPVGFRVIEIGGELAGFCWTKVHDISEEGEIYVIGVDPRFHGKGLGRLLVLDGLASLSGRGIRKGILYVDAANQAANHLYEHLGFTEARLDRCYVLTVTPTARPMA